MKNFVRLLAALVTLCMLFTLGACKKGEDSGAQKAENNDFAAKDQADNEDDIDLNDYLDDDDDNFVAESTAEVGELLDKPEKVVENLDFYVSVNFADEESETGIYAMEIAKDDEEDSGVLYLTNGSLKVDEAIYELDENDDLTVYKKDVFATEFTKVDMTEEEKEEEKQVCLDILNTLGVGYTYEEEGSKFKKLENDKFAITGEAFVYELIEDGKSAGKLWVDAKTGLFVKLDDADGKNVFTVIKIDTKNLGIPEYK